MTGEGLYGAQFEINYDPALLSASNVQVNPDLPLALLKGADNTTGKIRLVASRQGRVPGLTGDVPLLTFDMTAANRLGTTTLTFSNEKLGDPTAKALGVTTHSHIISITSTVTPAPGPTVIVTIEPAPTPTDTPTATITPTPGDTATISGQVILAGRTQNDWSGATITFSEMLSTTTSTGGSFSFTQVSQGTYPNVTADAPGYLPAVCPFLTVTVPEILLSAVTLLSGDLNDDNVVDIADATAIGANFGLTGSDLPVDLNRDQIIDVFDLILVSLNFGQGVQTWRCVGE